jgi:hypothetical protein
MYRQCLARVLAEHFVMNRFWTEAQALEVAQALLRNNVETIFPRR